MNGDRKKLTRLVTKKAAQLEMTLRIAAEKRGGTGCVEIAAEGSANPSLFLHTWQSNLKYHKRGS